MYNKFRQIYLPIIDYNALKEPTYRQAFDTWTHSLDAYCKTVKNITDKVNSAE